MLGNGVAPSTLRLRSHPAVRQELVCRTAWVFTCAGCGEDGFLADANVEQDGSLRCYWCWGGTAAGWCPGCDRVLEPSAFEAVPYRPSVDLPPELMESASKIRSLSGGRRRPRKLCQECQRQEQEPRTAVCAYCDGAFTPARRDARYCSGRCRTAAHRALPLSRGRRRP